MLVENVLALRDISLDLLQLQRVKQQHGQQTVSQLQQQRDNAAQKAAESDSALRNLTATYEGQQSRWVIAIANCEDEHKRVIERLEKEAAHWRHQASKWEQQCAVSAAKLEKAAAEQAAADLERRLRQEKLAAEAERRQQQADEDEEAAEQEFLRRRTRGFCEPRSRHPMPLAAPSLSLSTSAQSFSHQFHHHHPHHQNRSASSPPAAAATSLPSSRFQPQFSPEFLRRQQSRRSSSLNGSEEDLGEQSTVNNKHSSRRQNPVVTILTPPQSLQSHHATRPHDATADARAEAVRAIAEQLLRVL